MSEIVRRQKGNLQYSAITILTISQYSYYTYMITKVVNPDSI